MSHACLQNLRRKSNVRHARNSIFSIYPVFSKFDSIACRFFCKTCSGKTELSSSMTIGPLFLQIQPPVKWNHSFLKESEMQRWTIGHFWAHQPLSTSTCGPFFKASVPGVWGSIMETLRFYLKNYGYIPHHCQGTLLEASFIFQRPSIRFVS